MGGDNKIVLGAGGLFTLTGLITGNKKTEQTGLIILQTWLNAGLIVQAGKMLTGRQRPSFDAGIDRWRGFPASLNRYRGEPVSKYDAFPSGHTIEAWALATVIAEQYHDIKIVPVVSYTLATGVGLSRVTEDAHWLSDVILGAAMGYGIGRFMVREHQDTNWTLLPAAGGRNSNLTLVYRF
jgi:membrane-associated phospholipid phosphatase